MTTQETYLTLAVSRSLATARGSFVRGNGRVFISHAHDDNNRCKPLEAALSRWGVDYWFDTKRLVPGDELSTEIQKAIARSDVFLRICTVSAKRSWWVRLETDAFRALQAREHSQWGSTPRVFIPIILDADYVPDVFELPQLYVEAANRPAEVWLEELRQALDLPMREATIPATHHPDRLAELVVQAAPAALAVLNGPHYTVALANPPFRQLMGLDDATRLTGLPLADALGERADPFVVALRLDAVYQGGEAHSMIELPVHSAERGLTYWNITVQPILDSSSHVEGVLLTAVEVTRQVLARQRAQEVAEVTQERIGQMLSLHATSLEIARQLGTDPRELVADILRRSIALLGARAGTIYVRDERQDQLQVVVSLGLSHDYTDSCIRIGEGVAGQVALTGQGLVVDDLRRSPLRGTIYMSENLHTVIAVPLRYHRDVLGVLEVLDDAERRAFTDDDLWLLDMFASLAAQSIENSRTFEELERAYRKLLERVGQRESTSTQQGTQE